MIENDADYGDSNERKLERLKLFNAGLERSIYAAGGLNVGGLVIIANGLKDAGPSIAPLSLSLMATLFASGLMTAVLALAACLHLGLLSRGGPAAHVRRVTVSASIAVFGAAISGVLALVAITLFVHGIIPKPVAGRPVQVQVGKSNAIKIQPQQERPDLLGKAKK